MTYCVGMLIDEGLVMAADTRTNAGVDNVGKFKKLHTWSKPGQARLRAAHSRQSRRHASGRQPADGRHAWDK